MNDILEVQKKVIPEMIELLEKRYNILRSIYFSQPIGRRTLANSLELGERVIRTETTMLRESRLIDIDSSGMKLTDEGIDILNSLQDFMHDVKGLSDLEKTIADQLNIRKVIIVPGIYDEDSCVVKDIGKVASLFVKKQLFEGCIAGITGGTTMYEVVEALQSTDINKSFLIVPARGGVGANLEIQANNIAATFARKLRGEYKLLQAPDNVNKEAFESLVRLPEIQELVEIIKKLDILMFGIGRADKMAKRRKLSNEQFEELEKGNAVAEAFGYYFDIDANIVRESNTIGLQLEDFKKIKLAIGVACGKEKAEAMMAISRLKKDLVLIMDEGAARALLDKLF